MATLRCKEARVQRGNSCFVSTSGLHLSSGNRNMDLTRNREIQYNVNPSIRRNYDEQLVGILIARARRIYGRECYTEEWRRGETFHRNVSSSVRRPQYICFVRIPGGGIRFSRKFQTVKFDFPPISSVSPIVRLRTYVRSRRFV